MNSDEVLDWIHFANTTSSAKWEHTFKICCYILVQQDGGSGPALLGSVPRWGSVHSFRNVVLALYASNLVDYI